MARKFADVESYLASFPDDVRAVLEAVRRAVLRAVPDAEETIAYDMPTYRLDGTALVHFAGWTTFVSLYPMPVFEGALETELAAYRATRGTGRFPLDRPIPYDLIEQVVRAMAAARS
ncbi:DUF1801 domain-containing protein [Nocardioides sp. KIGAM211]|uniref:DUF1801 domain-containing protein n=1 Tax=Nocardioides luti TaxID=2761101 RepID=A0A7X0RJ33_9ACTN|nr:DUF1801 domain-containing protein [Nocardioides luti]MBB6627994.1 DUF1801 domain-containing protein [Nocardioides luti]